MKIILNNGALIDATGITLEPHFTIEAASREDFLEVWDLLTPENLQTVSIYKDDVLVTRFSDCVLTGTQTVQNGDGTFTAHFYLGGTTAPVSDPEFEEAYKILSGEVI